MEGSVARKQKWILTREGLEVFLGYLHADREQAGAQYERIRRTLLTFFRCNGCLSAEDAVDETIDRVIRRLGEVEVENLMPFIRGVARRVASELHKSEKEVSLADVSEPFQSGNRAGSEDSEEMERRIRCLEQSLRRLDEDHRELITQWYLYDRSQKIENKRRLAALWGASPAALRVRAFRARQQLLGMVQECLRASVRVM
jgi:RNA polymerase sigma factor (sigma-70 family)